MGSLMSTFNDVMVAVALNRFALGSETVTYTSPRDSISESISAVVVDSAGERLHDAQVWIRNDATLGVVSPRRGATITTAGGDVYRVVGFDSEHGIHRLDCKRPEAGA